MKRTVKGIVMEVNENSAVIITADGEFLNVKKPSSDISIGEEITSTAVYKSNFIKYTAIAAAIMIILIPFIYFKQVMATVAYVNVDINPSLELGINRYNNVNSVTPLNSDASELIKDMPLKGMNITDALGKMISTAKDMGYISENKQNNIEITLVKLKPDTNISRESLVECAKSVAMDTDVDVKIKAYNADKKVLDNAKKQNISPNKYMNKNRASDKIEIDIKKSAPGREKNKEEKTKGIENRPNDKNQNKVGNKDKKESASGSNDKNIKPQNNGTYEKTSENSNRDRSQKNKESKK